MLLALGLAPLLLIALGLFAYVAAGVRAGGEEPTGTLAGTGVRAAVRILRDARGIPHVRAANEADLFFAEGYLEGVDRLFQLDLYRRLISGRLSEIFGSPALQSDLAVRTCDVAAIAGEQLRRLGPRERRNLDAFAAGVNLAIRTRPLPPEFRVLGYQPAPWTARDSLVAAFSTVLTLTDGWEDVATRAEVIEKVGPAARDAFFPITDPAYDAPTAAGKVAPVAPLPPLAVPYPRASPLFGAAGESRVGLGSNGFAAGAARTATGRALLGNDPHLQLRMPGVWYLADLGAPGIHVTGATLPGVPGILLGHNEHLAWGATNGTVATVRVYSERFRSATSDQYLAGSRWVRAQRRTERFRVRFGKDVSQDYLRTRHGFIFREGGTTKLAAGWTADLDRRAAFEAFDGLDRAAGVAAALRALADYPGPPQNFVLADDRGNVGYVLAGEIPRQGSWGLRVEDGATSPPPARDFIPFGALPHVPPARAALAFNANNRPYGTGYPYRLSAAFEPPYRAAEIARELARKPYDVSRFSAIQADVTSLGEGELARATAAALRRKGTDGDTDLAALGRALASFDGRFDGDSHAAVQASELRRVAVERLVRLHMPADLGRRYLYDDSAQAFVAVLRMLRERPHGWVPSDDFDAFLTACAGETLERLRQSGSYGKAWSDVGARVAQHALASFRLGIWNGTPFPGFGDGFSPHVQGPSLAQSFRAVWDVGNWEAGGIVIPQGESGEPGSRHYRDGAPTWLAGTLIPLPFEGAAVSRAATTVLELRP